MARVNRRSEYPAANFPNTTLIGLIGSEKINSNSRLECPSDHADIAKAGIKTSETQGTKTINNLTVASSVV